ncbi:MAG: argininosuccinate lyase [Chitinophagales bacterium]|mgnify:CR=1 FL=1|nr:argininosuccinate lyase [Chitinophagales bacterium]
MKLWQKDNHKESDKSKIVERFTVGKDRELDLALVQYDVLGSKAHAEMLSKVGIITKAENKKLQRGLDDILNEIKKGKFKIDDTVEDVHSQIEFLLTERVGEAGKKIHTGRSRNDQVLLDIKLFVRHELKEITKSVVQLFDKLISLSEQHKDKLLPGYTHFQLAMPSSFGLWFGAYAESLIDDMEFVVAAHNIANKNPLGSGAGYGSAFQLDRKMTTKLLGFESMNHNSVYAQMTRGKTEKAAATAIAAIAATLSKFAYDVTLYMNQNFGFISFSEELTTGSSIMPHKKNPDVFELVRAKCNRLQAVPNELTLLSSNLPSGYHRDMQLTKDILFPAIKEIKDCIAVVLFALEDMRAKDKILDDPKYNELFSVEEINKEIIKGTPFRDAYKIVGKKIQEKKFNPEKKLKHTHEGSIKNLCNKEISQRMTTASKKILK